MLKLRHAFRQLTERRNKRADTKLLSLQRVGAVGLDQAEVGVLANLDATLVGQAKAVGDVGGHDLGEQSGAHTALLDHLIVHDIHAVLDAGDAAPGVKGVLGSLEVGRAGRVVGDDHGDGAVGEQLPQGVLLGLVADRGRALGDVADGVELVGREVQVVRAGLAGDVVALLLSGP